MEGDLSWAEDEYRSPALENIELDLLPALQETLQLADRSDCD